MPTTFTEKEMEEIRMALLPAEPQPDIDRAQLLLMRFMAAMLGLESDATENSRSLSEELATNFVPLQGALDEAGVVTLDEAGVVTPTWECTDCGRPMRPTSTTFLSSCTDGEPSCLACGVDTLVEAELDKSEAHWSMMHVLREEFGTGAPMMSQVIWSRKDERHPLHHLTVMLELAILEILDNLWGPEKHWKPASEGKEVHDLS